MLNNDTNHQIKPTSKQLRTPSQRFGIRILAICPKR